MADQPTAEQAADLAHELIQRHIDDTVNAIVGGGALGFTANIPTAEERAYYERQVFNSDGSVNETGKAALIDRIGIQGWNDVVEGFVEDQKKQQKGAPTIEHEQPLRY